VLCFSAQAFRFFFPSTNVALHRNYVTPIRRVHLQRSYVTTNYYVSHPSSLPAPCSNAFFFPTVYSNYTVIRARFRRSTCVTLSGQRCFYGRKPTRRVHVKCLLLLLIYTNMYTYNTDYLYRDCYLTSTTRFCRWSRRALTRESSTPSTPPPFGCLTRKTILKHARYKYTNIFIFESILIMWNVNCDSILV
jgi:hypothetical protein